VIAYFDTSAVVPLLVDESGSDIASATWEEASRAVSVALVYVEARAALARARRVDRLTSARLRTAVQELEHFYSEIDVIDVDDSLIREAGELAETHALRGYDALHLAAATRLVDSDVILVAGDAALLTAAASLGLATAPVS
jgi:uncharacterized protein